MLSVLDLYIAYWSLAGMILHEYFLFISPMILIPHKEESVVRLCFLLNKSERQAIKTRSCVCSKKRCEGDIVLS